MSASNYHSLENVRDSQWWDQLAWAVYTTFLRPNLPPLPESGQINIIDIGCGYAHYDIYVSRHYSHRARLVLFDKAGNETGLDDRGRTSKKRSLGGWHKDAAHMPFYRNDISVATELAVANGVPPENVEAVEASTDALTKMPAGSIDLVYSHMSYGYHYPAKTYGSAIFRVLASGGHLLLTLRLAGTTTNGMTSSKRLTLVSQEADLLSYGFRCANSSHTLPRATKARAIWCTKP
eukprot:CAMPEP_0119303734 /NCGR_PEP_ID=MMETSP1333-20130426/5116_1 /TAXON_ID=418940 /ORGANISM="Scyphosphaera apsteinii, Strain RCC1455" /LENGTH=234 /DNA_ID=CAMNT_0007306477 /DNA_START=220 /DNA_END=924 /DNA_ORIENTATION=-